MSHIIIHTVHTQPYLPTNLNRFLGSTKRNQMLEIHHAIGTKLKQKQNKQKTKTPIIGQHDSHSRSSLSIYNKLTFDISITTQYHVGITKNRDQH